MQLNKVISVCAKRDIYVWQIASRNIIKKIKSEKYIVIVPESEIDIFRAVSPGEYDVISENKYTEKFYAGLLMRAESSSSSVGWYMQQFLKLSALAEIDNEQIALIWDADTVPLKEIQFEKNGKILFYKGNENHKPYFETIKKLLNLDKRNNYSFVAQCIPCKGRWIKALLNEIEEKGIAWESAIINSIDFTKTSCFSEYETLGTYIEYHFNQEIEITNNKWMRYGTGLIGSVANLKYFSCTLSTRYDFISFEKWDQPYSHLKFLFKYFKLR